MTRVLLLVPNSTYRAADFMAAAERLGIEIVVGTEQDIDVLATGGSVALPYDDLDSAVGRIEGAASAQPFAAVVAVDDVGVQLAARAARRLGLPHNSPSAVDATRDKSLLRERMVEAGLPSPDFRVVPLDADLDLLAADIPLPCVVKPLALSGSRGVIRADDREQFVDAFERVRALLGTADVVAECGALADRVLIESYIPGIEVSVEGLLADGRLQTLAIFDKPDPLEGPYFEETIYVTPSRLPADRQRAVRSAAERAARALGLSDGPVHIELRINDDGIWPIDVAARSIGGLCARALTFGTGSSLEELILRHAIGEPPPSLERDGAASGVMMIPIPAAGVLRAVHGLSEAQSVPGVTDVTITMHVGQRVVPLPEGSEYLGFIFARGETAEDAESALRRAHAALRFDIAPPGDASPDPSATVAALS